jgi:mRNA-degrading endonuclease RelE of RelBE toxin-antitoxin system
MVYEEALVDYKSASQYYLKISKPLAQKYKSAVNTAFEDLKKNPFYQIRYDSFRLKVLKKFPYIIHYSVDEKTQIVYVYGIRHSAQNPSTTIFHKK